MTEELDLNLNGHTNDRILAQFALKTSFHLLHFFPLRLGI